MNSSGEFTPFAPKRPEGYGPAANANAQPLSFLDARTTVPDIFDEVSEDLRADRTRALLRRYGGVLIVAALAVVVGVGAYQAWKSHQATEAAREASQYFAAQALADAPGTTHADALPGFNSLAQNAAPGYRTLARLREAAIKAETKDLPGALALWNDVSTDSSADQILRDYASLQWALHQIDQGDPSVVEAKLQQLTGATGAWRTLALEGEALLALRQGQTDRARTLLKTLAADQNAPDGVRGRANGLLIRLGS